MAHYVSDPQTGFWHQPDKHYKSSLSSTATCVSSLVNANLWHNEKCPLRNRTTNVATDLISKRMSAGLDDDNPFSLSFVVEGVLDLIDAEPTYHQASDHDLEIKQRIAPKLLKHLMERDSSSLPAGCVFIRPYPPSAYLTQLVYRVLRRCGATKDREIPAAVHRWSRAEINKQIALITAKSRVGDPLQLSCPPLQVAGK
jgi:hypothetical protein